ncbi:MAG: aminodeoxychorismate/anthranilate synthase component II [Actinomycetota bacterium]
MKRPVLVIDNYDSFAYNLVQHLGALGQTLVVRRNDVIGLGDIRDLNPAAIVISPGPGTPRDAGISLDAIRAFGDKLPILGVCLGHQAIGEAYGANVVQTGAPVHGKTSDIFHDGKTIYGAIKAPFTATRYHSLIVDRETVPECLEISAWTKEGAVMGLRHKSHNVEGVQFHPESILTLDGLSLLRNFLHQAGLDTNS